MAQVRARIGEGQIILEGDQAALSKLQRIQSRLRDLRWLWPNILDLFMSKERLWFASQGRGSWPPLSAAYAEWKAKAYPGQPLLVLSGDMRGQLTSPRAVLAETDHSLVLGTSVSYAIYHLGGPKMPARPPLVSSVSMAAGLARRVQYEFERVI